MAGVLILHTLSFYLHDHAVQRGTHREDLVVECQDFIGQDHPEWRDRFPHGITGIITAGQLTRARVTLVCGGGSTGTRRDISGIDCEWLNFRWKCCEVLLRSLQDNVIVCPFFVAVNNANTLLKPMYACNNAYPRASYRNLSLGRRDVEEGQMVRIELMLLHLVQQSFQNYSELILKAC